MLSEQEKNNVREEVKEILSNFSKSLDSVKSVGKVSFASGEARKEGKGQVYDGEFRKAMFSNAPNSNDDCIVAEKGGW